MKFIYIQDTAVREGSFEDNQDRRGYRYSSFGECVEKDRAERSFYCKN